MYELSLGAPTGDLLIGLKPEAAEAVKLAVLDALKKHLIEPKAAPVAVKTSQPRERVQTPPAIGEPAEAPQAAAAAPVAPQRDALGRQRAGFRVVPEVMGELLPILRLGVKHAMTGKRAHAVVNVQRKAEGKLPVSNSTVGRALARLAEGGEAIGAPGIVKGASPKAWGWYRFDTGTTASGPATVNIAAPQVTLDRNGFTVSLAAGEGVVKGAV